MTLIPPYNHWRYARAVSYGLPSWTNRPTYKSAARWAVPTSRWANGDGVTLDLGLAGLQDARRSGCPRTFVSPTRVQVISVASALPQVQERTVTQWTLEKKETDHEDDDRCPVIGASRGASSRHFGVLGPRLEEQLRQAETMPGSALEALITNNQEFHLLRPEEANDKLGLPHWLRVWWRKAHPESSYSANDPTGGYPRVLKNVLA